MGRYKTRRTFFQCMYCLYIYKYTRTNTNLLLQWGFLQLLEWNLKLDSRYHSLYIFLLSLVLFRYGNKYFSHPRGLIHKNKILAVPLAKPFDSESDFFAALLPSSKMEATNCDGMEWWLLWDFNFFWRESLRPLNQTWFLLLVVPPPPFLPIMLLLGTCVGKWRWNLVCALLFR